LAVLCLTFTNELCQLWNYWSEFHILFAQHRGIMCVVNAHIEAMISRSVSEYQSNEVGGICLPSFRQHYLVAMATCLDNLENKVQIHH